MKFDVFIEDNLDAVVEQWQAFARTMLPAAEAMSDLALCNDSREILLAIVKDMRTSQSESERLAKSPQAELTLEASETVAAAHGALRQAAGFDLAQVVSEFRAMRASVLALWRRSESTVGKTPAIEEIARFNEAIDQALGESVQRFSSAVAASRDMFVAVLGHDLRSPLQGIETACAVLAMPTLADGARLETAQRIRRASKAMSRLITDLLEYTRSRLGRGIPIDRADCDLRRLCEEAVDAARASASEHRFVAQLSGDLHLRADRSRMQQVLSNLLDNAVQHGDKGSPVSLSARGEDDAIVLAVANGGKPIPPEALRVIFEPLVQVADTTFDLTSRPTSSMGLGLFIVREIVIGHHGTIEVRSTAAAGTVFTIRLPRTDAGENGLPSSAR